MEEENVIRPHQEIQALTIEEKKFLLSVERGDVAGTRRLVIGVNWTNGLSVAQFPPHLYSIVIDLSWAWRQNGDHMPTDVIFGIKSQARVISKAYYLHFNTYFISKTVEGKGEPEKEGVKHANKIVCSTIHFSA